MLRILLVCLGNICRSPMAESVFHTRLAERGWTDRVLVDSAGTYAGHAGEAPDPRAQTTARAHGHHAIGRLRARPVEAGDFERFDLVLAMDRDNLARLREQCPVPHQHKLHLFLAWAQWPGVDEVPDPYYGNAEGFERVMALCECATDAVLDHFSDSLAGAPVPAGHSRDQTRDQTR
jgi:protein-tyrosine phosphatase